MASSAPLVVYGTGAGRLPAPVVPLPVGPPATAMRALSPTGIALKALLILAFLLVNKLGAGGSAVFFLVLFAMSFRSPEAAFLSFLIGMVGLATNFSIVPKNLVWTPLRLVLPFLAMFRFAFDLSHQRKSLFADGWYLALCVFVGVAALCSMAGGYYVEISMLKLVTFTTGMSAVFAGVKVLQSRRYDLGEWMIAVVAVIVLNGVLAIATGTAYRIPVPGEPVTLSSSFFKGPFYHANLAGPYCALAAVLLFCFWLTVNRRGTWVAIVLAVPLMYFVWLSRSRTGLVSLIFGIASAFLFAGIAPSLQTWRRRLGRRRTQVMVMGLVAVCLLAVGDVATGVVSKSIREFVVKYNKSATTIEVEDVMSSRASIITQQWETFLRNPLTGIGFQVADTEYFRRNATLFSAPVEKGFLPTGLLEEVGLLGTSTFALFIGLLALSLVLARNGPGLVMLLTYLVTNLGEMTIFAFGGAGGMGWLFVAMGILIGNRSTAVAKTIVQAGGR